MLLSEEAKLAERNLSVVAWHIEKNPLIARDFIDTAGRPLLEPDPDEDKWTDSEIIVRREGKTKDPTWQAKGLDSKGIQGSRLRHFFGDDVITPASAYSVATQEKAIRLIDEQLTTRVKDEGQAVFIGNFNHGRDALSQLARRNSYAVLRRPSLFVPPNRAEAPKDPADPEAELQLPEVWPRRRLNQEREEKPNRFRRIHLLDDEADVGERLKREWLHVIDEGETPVGRSRFFIALDPAGGGEGDDLDFFNISVGAAHGKGEGSRLDLVISHDGRWPLGDALDYVAAYHDRFDRVGRGVAAIGVAKVMLDRWFGAALAIMRPDLRRKLVPISIGTASKEERLEALGPYARSGWLRIWQGALENLTSDPEDRPDELSFVEQWVGLGPAGLSHDDKLDGADVLCRTAIEFGGKGEKRKVRVKAGSRRA
jgi:hypothetical protein